MRYPEQVKTNLENPGNAFQPDKERGKPAQQVKEESNMATNIYPADNAAYIKHGSEHRLKNSVEKYLPKRCSMDQLEEIRIGDRIVNADGIKGIVTDVYISSKKYESHYYLRLKHGVTLLYII